MLCVGSTAGCIAALLAAIVVASPCAKAEAIAGDPPAGHPRLFRVDDLFELEDIASSVGGPFTFSSDGEELAFTRLRARKALSNFKHDFLFGKDGGDVWVQLHRGADPVNLTNGITDGSGWWSPQWSPGGHRLAMLSTRGGTVQVWAWERDTGKIKRLASRGVDLQVASRHPCGWIDANQVLCTVLADHEQPQSLRIELQTPQIATREWPKAGLGREPTASVLDSGVPVDLTQRPQRDLLAVNAVGGHERVIAHGVTGFWQLSPDRKVVAFTSQLNVYLPKANEPLPFDSSGGAATIGLAALDGKPIALRGEVTRDVLTESLRWSPDGRELAFYGRSGARDPFPRLYRASLPSHTVTSRSLEGLDVSPAVDEPARLEWTATGDLLAYAVPVSGDGGPGLTTRRDWWLVSADRSPRCLTEDLAAVPQDLWPEKGRRRFVGLAEGRLWRLDVASGKAENLTEGFAPKIERLLYPRAASESEHAPSAPSDSQLIFTARDGGRSSTYGLELSTGEVTVIATPSARAEVVGYEPATHTGIFYESDRDGLQVWWGDVRHPDERQVLVAANGFLHNVAEGTFRKIEYISLNGEPLKGWILLPPGYIEGNRYPLITWVYAGSVYGDQPPHYLGSIGSSSTLNLQIAAAHGYAVLFPSMPLAPDGATDDPMLRLPEGVLPAVDRAIQIGLADPERLFLMGHSYGGYAVYGLVSQTRRFKAAISMAGLSDLISLYGQFDARERYDDHSQENLFQEALMESSQGRMGNPPWKDLGRYLRNSPIFSVDRVQTPLLIVQGDLDYIALQQGEEFFTSLYRQGKRAEFVRYWGEGHVLESPANIRDMWSRVFAWFDDFGDLTRDADGNLVWDGVRVKLRNGAPRLTPADFLRLDGERPASVTH